MIKTVRLIRRDPNLTPAQFKWQWLTRHGALLSQAVDLTPIRRVTASFLTPSQITVYTPGNQLPIDIDFDGVEQIYFATGADLRATVAMGVLEELTAAEDGLSDNGLEVRRSVQLEETMCERPEAEDSARHRLKLIRTVTRKKGLDMYQFRDYWHNHHKVIEMGGVLRGNLYRTNVSFSLSQNVRITDGKISLDEGDTEFDAFMDMYYLLGTDIPAQYAVNPFSPGTRRDENNFINFDAPLYRALLDEYVIADSGL